MPTAMDGFVCHEFDFQTIKILDRRGAGGGAGGGPGGGGVTGLGDAIVAGMGAEP
jgi:hypothetical protein